MKPLDDISDNSVFLKFFDLGKLVFFKQQHAMHPLNALDVTRDDYLKARANFALDWARDRMREDFGLYCHESCKFVHIASMDNEPNPG